MPGSRNRKFSYPPGYAALRAFILRRDGFVCYVCEGHATQVDHLVPRSMGGGHTPENLRAICGDCNNRRNNRVHAECRTSQYWLEDEEMLETVEWVDELPPKVSAVDKPERVDPYPELRQQLQERPGEWALIDRVTDVKEARSLAMRARWPGYSLAFRRVDEGQYHVFAKFNVEEQPADTADNGQLTEPDSWLQTQG